LSTWLGLEECYFSFNSLSRRGEAEGQSKNIIKTGKFLGIDKGLATP
jgi:hypothetical protein